MARVAQFIAGLVDLVLRIRCRACGRERWSWQRCRCRIPGNKRRLR